MTVKLCRERQRMRVRDDLRCYWSKTAGKEMVLRNAALTALEFLFVELCRFAQGEANSKPDDCRPLRLLRVLVSAS